MRKLIEIITENNIEITKNQMKYLINSLDSQIMNYQDDSDIGYLNNNDAFLNLILSEINKVEFNFGR